MKQLTQKLKDGTMKVLDVPQPTLGAGMLLVRTHYSLISPGTEGSTVKTARKSLLAKAKERPQQVQQVLDVLRQQGPVQTYRAVMKKLDSYSPLGYSAAGEVVAVADDVTGFVAGDRVACAGVGYASHAEYLAVPRNLCVRLAPDAALDSAAYNTLGAIAMQGVRQADLRLGESCVVIGLGLLGHLTGLILKASGVQVIGADIDAGAVELAARHCCDSAHLMNDPGLVQAVEQATDGIGADAVIITAATASLEPINLAGRLARKRGTVVIVGDVATGFDRDPDYYRKELSVRMSCSYGPGRYDPTYEERGLDYPAAYVRWTEKRNMQAFQSLIARGDVQLDYLTSHRFALDDAPKAYELIVSGAEKVLGVIIEYDVSTEPSAPSVDLGGAATRVPHDGIAVSFIGAGSYAMSHLLPNVSGHDGVTLAGVMTSSGTSARTVADKFGFGYATPDSNDLLDPSRTSTVFIATRHDSHAAYVRAAMEAGLQVFVEKPLCLEREELAAIDAAYVARCEAGDTPLLMVGFNRRFAPLALRMKNALGEGPMAMTYRVNAGHIPGDSWIQDAKLGGGRILGEACHFVDFLTWLNGSLPLTVYANALRGGAETEDTVSVVIGFENGSTGVIGYYANGGKALPKEYVEAHRGGVSAVLDDFRAVRVYRSGRPDKDKAVNQNKGQPQMVRAFLEAALGRTGAPIPYDELRAVTRATFAVRESIRSGQAVRI